MMNRELTYADNQRTSMSKPSREHWSHRVVEPYLDEHGPTPRPALPVNNLSAARERGVGVFAPYRGPSNSKPTVNVVYLPTQSREVVLRVWIEANAKALDETSRSTVTRRISERYDEEWVSAWRTCAKEAGVETHQQAPENPAKDPKRPCPTCGEPIRARRFVKHVSECC